MVNDSFPYFLISHNGATTCAIVGTFQHHHFSIQRMTHHETVTSQNKKRQLRGQQVIFPKCGYLLFVFFFAHLISFQINQKPTTAENSY